jgi:hypothetical protein
LSVPFLTPEDFLLFAVVFVDFAELAGTGQTSYTLPCPLWLFAVDFGKTSEQANLPAVDIFKRFLSNPSIQHETLR